MAQSRTRRRAKRLVRAPRPRLTISQILVWADEYRERTGHWPTHNSGWIARTADDKWVNVDCNLRYGLRGLRPGSSLARLFAEYRGHRNRSALPRLTVRIVLQWADAHHKRTGHWPRVNSGRIPEAPGESWSAIHANLHPGHRGLPGGTTLPRLLQTHRGVRNCQNMPVLTIAQILRWADKHFRQTGRWPNHQSGRIHGATGEQWLSIDRSLRLGTRGLRPGSSLIRLLAKHRDVRNRKKLPRLTDKKILTWADAYHHRTGKWPRVISGPINGILGESWLSVDSALRRGARGMPQGGSLARLLFKHGRLASIRPKRMPRRARSGP